VDSIAVERKYVTPYVIRPSHTLILHTNHRPEIKALDNGTWRRIILLPFYAQIANDNDIKNYGDFLAEKAGEAILSWLIEGAERMYKRGFNLDTPQLVQEVTDSYKSENNWISPFLDEYCETDNKSEGFTVQTKDIYTAYCQFCLSSGVVPHNKKDVYSAIEAQGFRRFKKNNTLFFMGLRLQSTVETLF
jgi:P4 family phage/plasmid primase-like protien